MARAWLKARQTQYTAYASVYILLVLAVLAGINFLANRYDKSHDSTANKQFSLSDQTIKVVKGLKTQAGIRSSSSSSSVTIIRFAPRRFGQRRRAPTNHWLSARRLQLPHWKFRRAARCWSSLAPKTTTPFRSSTL